MKTSLSLQELAQQITERAQRKEDFIVDTASLTMNGKATDLEFDAPACRHFKLNGLMHEQISSHHEIPWRYYDRMRQNNAELLAANVNSWLRHKPQRRMVRTLDGTARAYLSTSYNRMDDDAFAEIVLPVVAQTKGAEVMSCAIEPEKTYIKFVSRRLEREVKVGDHVQFGIAFSNSEVGRGMLQGSLFMLQLRCLNGMVVPSEMWGSNHVDAGHRNKRNLAEIFKLDTMKADGTATLLKLRDFASDLLTERRIDEYVSKMRELTQIEIKAPGEAITKLAKTEGLSEVEQNSVLAHLIKGGDLSLWGLQNAVTAAAQDDGISYTRATELETLGGRMLTLDRTYYKELALAA